jgi:ATP sulfurylase
MVPPEYVYDKFYPKYGYRFSRRKNMKVSCSICGRIHDSNGAFVRIADGMAIFRCFADDKKRKLALGPTQFEEPIVFEKVVKIEEARTIEEYDAEKNKKSEKTKAAIIRKFSDMSHLYPYDI